MLLYSAFMFAAGVLFLGLAAAVYRGNTNLIHDYHQTRVKDTDKEEYGKSFSKGLLIIAIALIFSGIIALLGKTTSIVFISIGVLFVGIIIAFIIIKRVQKRFNGGFF